MSTPSLKISWFGLKAILAWDRSTAHSMNWSLSSNPVRGGTPTISNWANTGEIAATCGNTTAPAPLHVFDGVARLALVPTTVEIFGNSAELNYQIVRQVFGFNLAAFLSPQPNQHRSSAPPHAPTIAPTAK